MNDNCPSTTNQHTYNNANNSAYNNAHNNAGHTLLELVVGLGIISTLMLMASPEMVYPRPRQYLTELELEIRHLGIIAATSNKAYTADFCNPNEIIIHQADHLADLSDGRRRILKLPRRYAILSAQFAAINTPKCKLTAYPNQTYSNGTITLGIKSSNKGGDMQTCRLTISLWGITQVKCQSG